MVAAIESGSPLPMSMEKVSSKLLPDDPVEMARKALSTSKDPSKVDVSIILEIMGDLFVAIFHCICMKEFRVNYFSQGFKSFYQSGSGSIENVSFHYMYTITGNSF